MLRGLAIALLVSGCYSPSFRPCEIKCPDGETCPSGYVCEPVLYTCVPEDNPAACDTTVGDGGARDTSGGDGAQGDAQVFGMYCTDLATVTNYLFCRDFDAGTIAQQGWMQVSTGNGSTTLVGPGFSSPFQLDSFVPMSTNFTEGRVRYPVSVTTSFNSLSVYFRMRMAERTGVAPMGVLSILNGSSTVNLISDAGGSLSGSTSNGQASFSVPSATLLAWGRYEIRFVNNSASDAGPPGLSVLLYMENTGNPIGSFGSIPLPSFPTTFELHVGIAGGNNNGLVRFNYDDIVVYN